MSLIPSKCIEFNEERKICIAFEKGKIYRLNNNSSHKIKKVKIDNCIQQNKGEKRCDYLMEIKAIKKTIFIELKGGDLVHALRQLYSTIIYFKTEFSNYQIDARIIGSRDVPGFINTADYIRLEKEIRPTKGTIKRGTNNIYIESI
ncbi:MAG TPA: hypothetical protein VGP55_10795 [Chitinophagaceae bacterium]|nr:hypothetical protein [Chitinophagaceae bacterium]